jgi:hypothetical protein
MDYYGKKGQMYVCVTTLRDFTLIIYAPQKGKQTCSSSSLSSLRMKLGLPTLFCSWVPSHERNRGHLEQGPQGEEKIRLHPTIGRQRRSDFFVRSRWWSIQVHYFLRSTFDLYIKVHNFHYFIEFIWTRCVFSLVKSKDLTRNSPIPRHRMKATSSIRKLEFPIRFSFWKIAVLYR